MTTKKKDTPTGFKESANEIWLAGLGAFNIVGTEGRKLFKELVEKGRAYEDEHEGGPIAKLTERAKDMKDGAKDILDKVTTPIEEGISSTMQRLGMPTHTEIARLTARVEELTRLVHQSRQAKAEPPARPAQPKAQPKAQPAAQHKAQPKPMADHAKTPAGAGN